MGMVRNSCAFSLELIVFVVHPKSKQVSCSIPPFFLLSLQVSSSGWVPAWRERECSLIPTYQASVKGANWWYWWVLRGREYRECALFCQHCPVGRLCSSCWISWEWNIPKGRWNNREIHLLDGSSRWEGYIGVEQLHLFCVFVVCAKPWWNLELYVLWEWEFPSFLLGHAPTSIFSPVIADGISWSASLPYSLMGKLFQLRAEVLSVRCLRRKTGRKSQDLFSSYLCLICPCRAQSWKIFIKPTKSFYVDVIFPRIVQIEWLIPWILLAGPNSFSLGTFTKYPRCGGNQVEKGVYKLCVSCRRNGMCETQEG